jgi:hypothetical protein
VRGSRRRRRAIGRMFLVSLKFMSCVVTDSSTATPPLFNRGMIQFLQPIAVLKPFQSRCRNTSLSPRRKRPMALAACETNRASGSAPARKSPHPTVDFAR